MIRTLSVLNLIFATLGIIIPTYLFSRNLTDEYFYVLYFAQYLVIVFESPSKTALYNFDELKNSGYLKTFLFLATTVIPVLAFVSYFYTSNYLYFIIILYAYFKSTQTILNSACIQNGEIVRAYLYELGYLVLLVSGQLIIYMTNFHSVLALASQLLISSIIVFILGLIFDTKVYQQIVIKRNDWKIIFYQFKKATKFAVTEIIYGSKYVLISYLIKKENGILTYFTNAQKIISVLAAVYINPNTRLYIYNVKNKNLLGAYDIYNKIFEYNKIILIIALIVSIVEIFIINQVIMTALLLTLYFSAIDIKFSKYAIINNNYGSYMIAIFLSVFIFFIVSVSIAFYSLKFVPLSLVFMQLTFYLVIRKLVLSNEE